MEALKGLGRSGVGHRGSGRRGIIWLIHAIVHIDLRGGADGATGESLRVEQMGKRVEVLVPFVGRLVPGGIEDRAAVVLVKTHPTSQSSKAIKTIIQQFTHRDFR